MASVLSAGLSIVGGIMGNRAQSSAAKNASGDTIAAAQMGIDEQRRQFDKLQELLKPFVDTGVSSIGMQKNILGLGTPEEQQQIINQISNDPILQQLVAQGENALLQQASATGGLRGGNVQSALAQFRPEMVNQAIQQRFANLGGLTQLGQASAANVGAAGTEMAGALSKLFGEQGAARAGNVLAQGKLRSDMWQALPGMFNMGQQSLSEFF